MKKIAYIELDTHAEILLNFKDCLQDSTNFTVDFYVSQKIASIIGNDNNIHICTEKNIVQLLQLEKYDLIILGTVHRYFSTFLEITEKFRTAVIIHNTNFSTISKGKIINSLFIKDFIYRLKLLWKEGLYSASKVYQKSQYLLLLDEKIFEKTQNYLLTERKKEKRAFYLPVFINEFSQPEKSDLTIIVIPGTVSQKRRDYQHLFSFIKNSKSQQQFHFIFLGKASGTELQELKDLKNNLPKNISIEFFKEKVSSTIFEECMLKADVLWCPIQPKTEFLSQEEIYGETKMTGNLGDAIKYGKPAIFPTHYKNNYPFIFEEEKDVFKQFSNLKNFQFNFQENFNKEKINNEIERVLLVMIG